MLLWRTSIILKIEAPRPAADVGRLLFDRLFVPGRAFTLAQPRSTSRISPRSIRAASYARAKMMQEGLPVSTTWPVGVSLPVLSSTRNAMILSLSRFAA
jgi:hypothetical protein